MENELANAPIGANLAQKQSLLDSALTEHFNQLDKLDALLSALDAQLMPLRNTYPNAEDGVAQSEPPTSPVVSAMRSMTDRVKCLQSVVAKISNELEV